MTMRVYGGHVWDHIDVGGHNCELGHRKEAKRARGGRCQSCKHARTVKRQTIKQDLARRRKVGLPTRGCRPGEMLRGNKPTRK